MLQHRWIALTESIDVDDGAEIIQLVVAREFRGFPIRALDWFAVAHQHIGAMVKLVHIFGAQRDADADRRALSQWSGGHVDKGEAGCGMPFQVWMQRPQFQQLFFGEEPGLGPGGIEEGSGMALREDEPVAIGSFLILRIVPHDWEKEGGNDVGGGAAARRMPTAGRAGRPYALDAQMCGRVSKGSELFLWWCGYRHGAPCVGTKVAFKRASLG